MLRCIHFDPLLPVHAIPPKYFEVRNAIAVPAQYIDRAPVADEDGHRFGVRGRGLAHALQTGSNTANDPKGRLTRSVVISEPLVGTVPPNDTAAAATTAIGGVCLDELKGHVEQGLGRRGMEDRYGIGDGKLRPTPTRRTRPKAPQKGAMNLRVRVLAGMQQHLGVGHRTHDDRLILLAHAFGWLGWAGWGCFDFLRKDMLGIPIAM